MRRDWLACALLLLYAPPLQAAPAPSSLQELLQRSAQHHPQIEAAIAQREQREGAVTQALGAFDASLEQTNRARPLGYYDGASSTTSIVQPLQSMNAKLSAGYRVADGRFPIYENYDLTNRGGEFNVSLFFSLLRDREIDEDRLRLRTSELQAQKAAQELLLQQISTQRAAMISYLDWVAAARVLAVQQELTELARQRADALKRKHAQGDVAAIALTENAQALYRREGQLTQAQQRYRNAAANLSLYWRDATGAPIAIPVVRDVDFPDLPAPIVQPDQVADEVMVRLRPEMQLLEADLAIQKNELAAGENSLLPRADLSLRTAQDIGGGSFTRRDTEQVIGLSLSIPLQQRTGEGRVRKARAQIRALAAQQRLLRDQIRQQLQILHNDLDATRRLIALSTQEIQAASRMQDAESRLQAQGGSDFFLLNTREEQRAQAQLQNIQARLTYLRAVADSYAATLNTAALGLAS